MSDTSKQELIEEAAKAIYAARAAHDGRTWDGLEDHEWEAHRDKARAAFAVFEQATAPTDDEILYCPFHGDLLSAPRSYRCHNAPKGHEFRRTAVQEPRVIERHDLVMPIYDEPTERTSNYGWAVWHLTQAKHATSVAEAQMHAACANARAQLQVSCEMGAQRGVDPTGPTLWTEEWA